MEGGPTAVADYFASKADYYRLAGQFLHSYWFVNDRQRRIWELHSEGVPYRKIATEVRETLTDVHHAIRHLREIMLGQRKRRPGRRRQPHERGRDAAFVRVRLSDTETEALFTIMDHGQQSRVDAVRTAILAYAKAIRLSGISDSHISQTRVPR